MQQPEHASTSAVVEFSVLMSAAAPTAVRPVGRTGSSLLNMRRKNIAPDESAAGPSTTMSEPPPSPQLAYFDKYPKRAERLRDKEKHVTIEFPTIPDRKSSAPRHTGGLRDWRVVQAHLEPRVAPRNPRRRDKDKDREKDGAPKIRDPDDMVIVSLAGSPSPTAVSTSLPPSPAALSDEPTPTERTPHVPHAGPSSHETSRRRPTKTPSFPSTSAPPSASSSTFTFTPSSARPPPSPSLASGFRSSLISSAGTLTSSAATDASALTPPRTPTSPHDPVLIASSSVEAMDALIEGMGSTVSLDSVSFLSPSFSRASRFGYPLYQPPLPTPPDGIKLGIVAATEEPWRRRRGGKNAKASKEKDLPGTDADWSKRYEDDYDDTETETDASPFPSRRTPTTSTSTFASAKSPALGRNSSSSASSAPRAESAPPSRASTPSNANASPSLHRSATSSTVTTTRTAPPPIWVRSDEEIEAEERADVTSPLVPPVRVRQRSGLSVRSTMSGRSRTTGSERTLSTSSTGSSVHRARRLARSPGMWDLSNASSSTDLMETDGAMDAIIRDHVSRSGEEKPRKNVVPSIDEIIRMHAPAVVAANQAVTKRGASRNGSPSVPSTPITTTAPSLPGSSFLGTGTGTNTPRTSTPGHSRSTSRDETEAEAEMQRSSIDSIADEAQRALQALQDQEAAALPRRRASMGKASSVGAGAPSRLQHARSFPKARASSVQGESSSLSPYFRSPLSDGASICSGNSGNTVVLPSSLGRAATTPVSAAAGDNTLEMAQYLRSPRLTRLLTLRRPANAGLTVSLADVGSLTGRPVIVYLGLGCVRYLVALYDEMAEALNLRLICVDRWGLGRTTDVPTERRGLLEWAGVVEEVADTLGLGRYSVLAHSAGAPYALASSLKAGERLFGSVHLLAPWVSMAVDGGYKWLKYVPNGLIRTAQAAEWKLQGWMIGKPPTIQYEGIGFDATAPLSGTPETGRPSFSSFSEYDELDDFDGRFASRSTLAYGGGTGALNSEEGEKEKKGAKPRQVSSKSASADSVGDTEVGDGSGSRPRKGSKLIFGGLFPKGGQKRGMSTPPNAFSTPQSSTPPPPVPPVPPVPSSPPTPTPGTTARPQKLKALRSMSSLKAPSTKSEPAKSKDRNVSVVGLGLGMDAEADADVDVDGEETTARTQAWASEFVDADAGGRARQRRSLSLTARPSTAAAKFPNQPAPPSSPRSPNTNTKTVTLASALLQASHAESLKGGTADLLSILERDSKPWGFSYADVRQPVRVWYGDRDDKIGVGSVRWMERVMRACEVKIVKGAGHSLMTNAEVVVEVLESIAREWDELG
ncbi:hypothetical protein FRC06_001298 [Ceratobasidium sp. 370]|nr:hypothetical protein FRC06_001298 [Ceratobasidium sp. 370]